MSRRPQEAGQGRGKGAGLPPVPGRRHADLQTDSWLEEISDKKEEKEMGIQVGSSVDINN